MKTCSEKENTYAEMCSFIEITLQHGCSPVNLMHIFRTSFHRNTSGELPLHGTVEIFLANFGYIHWKKPLTFFSNFHEMCQVCNVCPQCGKIPVGFLYSLILIFSFLFSLLVSKVFQLFFSCQCHPTALSSHCFIIFWVTVTPKTSAIALNVHCIPLMDNRVGTSTANLISQGELCCS